MVDNVESISTASHPVCDGSTKKCPGLYLCVYGENQVSHTDFQSAV